MKWMLAVAAAIGAVVLAVVLLQTDDPPDFVVNSGQDLGLTPEDQLVHSFSTGVWTGTMDGTLVTLQERHLFGDEGGETTAITLSLADATPEVIQAGWTSSDAYGGDKSQD
ncbi:MAG: hypothetical protein HKN93_11725, partial [Acidimicrobiia bacterium]|nr:hypothetical protein [Acidimicrobiia bacterium]